MRKIQMVHGESSYNKAILPGYNFTLGEVVQGNTGEYRYIETRYMDNIVLGAIMYQLFRERIGRPISVQSWFRPEYYNDVVMIENGYHTSVESDHKEARAIDSDVPATAENIALWKEICKDHDVFWSIGKYGWGLHLGFRFESGNREWGENWYK